MTVFARWSERFRSRPKLRIEPLMPVHAAAVAHLHGRSFAHGWDQPEVARMLGDRAILADGIFAGSATLPCGFVMSRLVLDEAEILTICIDAAQRGAGLGRMLLAQHQINVSRRGISQLFLEVDASNAPALALYRRFGFTQVGTRPGYYPKPDGSRAMALILRRELS